MRAGDAAAGSAGAEVANEDMDFPNLITDFTRSRKSRRTPLF
jgi:hypothetical protein